MGLFAVKVRRFGIENFRKFWRNLIWRTIQKEDLKIKLIKKSKKKKKRIITHGDSIVYLKIHYFYIVFRQIRRQL